MSLCIAPPPPPPTPLHSAENSHGRVATVRPWPVMSLVRTDSVTAGRATDTDAFLLVRGKPSATPSLKAGQLALIKS